MRLHTEQVTIRPVPIMRGHWHLPVRIMIVQERAGTDLDVVANGPIGQLRVHAEASGKRKHCGLYINPQDLYFRV